METNQMEKDFLSSASAETRPTVMSQSDLNETLNSLTAVPAVNINTFYNSGSWNFVAFVALRTITGVIMLPTIFGNVLTLVAIAKYNRLRTITNAFVASLACADITVGVGLFAMFNLLGSPAGTAPVLLWTSSFPLYVSFINLIAVAGERCFAIMFPFHHHRWMTPSCTVAIIALAWFTSALLVGMDTILVGNASMSFFAISVEITVYLLALVILVFLHLVVLYIARKQAKKILSQTSASNVPATTAAKLESKATKMVSVILLSFIVFWLPCMMVAMLPYVCLPCYTAQWNMTNYFLATLGMCNSAINVLLYAIVNSDFRRAFKALLGCENVKKNSVGFTATSQID